MKYLKTYEDLESQMNFFGLDEEEPDNIKVDKSIKLPQEVLDGIAKVFKEYYEKKLDKDSITDILYDYNRGFAKKEITFFEEIKKQIDTEQIETDITKEALKEIIKNDPTQYKKLKEFRKKNNHLRDLLDPIIEEYSYLGDQFGFLDDETKKITNSHDDWYWSPEEDEEDEEEIDLGSLLDKKDK